ncbi:MAG: hypothetical protein WCG42_05405 [Parachlamydiaceae bacterium]
MKQEILSKRKANAISNGLLFIGIGILYYTNTWWPGILLVAWASLGMRQYLSGRIYDLVISSIILLGLFGITIFDIKSAVLVPVLFIIGGIYIIFREYFFGDDLNGEEKSQEIKDDTDE